MHGCNNLKVFFIAHWLAKMHGCNLYFLGTEIAQFLRKKISYQEMFLKLWNRTIVYKITNGL
jgi:hypothetical protein